MSVTFNDTKLIISTTLISSQHIQELKIMQTKVIR